MLKQNVNKYNKITQKLKMKTKNKVMSKKYYYIY